VIILHSIAILSVALSAAICLYHVALAFVALLRRQRPVSDDSPKHRFALVIPDHNEESVIANTLRSCKELKYPKDMYELYVIADNCSDRTPEIAVTSGAKCLVRHDLEQRGKGQALEWALPQVLRDTIDAVVILDADCLISPNALTVFDQELGQGHRVLQARCAVENVDDNPTSYLLAVANAIENDLFYGPKSYIGSTVLLRGTGMAFHRAIITSNPWKAGSVVEDTEYTCALLRRGHSVHFVESATILSECPSHAKQLAVQRGRWIGGNLRCAFREAPKLAFDGLRSCRIVLLDAALTLLILSRPLIAIQLLFSIMLAILSYCIGIGEWPLGLLLTCGAIVITYCFYIAAGAVKMGISRRRAFLALALPFSMARYVFIAITSLLTSDSSWVRTPRTNESACQRA